MSLEISSVVVKSLIWGKTSDCSNESYVTLAWCNGQEDLTASRFGECHTCSGVTVLSPAHLPKPQTVKVWALQQKSPWCFQNRRNKSKSYKTLRVFLLFSTTLDGPLAKIWWGSYRSGSPSEDHSPAREGNAIPDNEAEETAVGVWEKDTLTGQSHLYSIRIAIADFFCFAF